MLIMTSETQHICCFSPRVVAGDNTMLIMTMSVASDQGPGLQSLGIVSKHGA